MLGMGTYSCTFMVWPFIPTTQQIIPGQHGVSEGLMLVPSEDDPSLAARYLVIGHVASSWLLVDMATA